MSVPYGTYYSPDRILAELRYQDKKSQALDAAQGMLTNRLSDVFAVPGDPTFEVGQRIPRDIFRPPETFQEGPGLVGPAPSRPPLTPGFETGPPVSPGTTLEAIDLPRQLVKEHVIEPIVPDFEFTIPKEIARAGVTGFPVAREVQAIAGLAGEELPDVKITDEVVEEMASWVLDPLNLLPVVGFAPEILRAARAAKKAGPVAVRTFIKGLAKSGDEDALRALKSAVDTSAEAPIARLPGEELGDVSQARLPSEPRQPLPKTPLAAARRVNDLIASKITGGIPEGAFVGPTRDLKPGAVIRGTTPTGQSVEGTVSAVGARRISIRTADDSILPVTRESVEVVTKAPSPGIGQRIGGVIRATQRGVTQPGAVAPLDPSVIKFNKLLRTAKPTARGVTAEQAAARAKRVPAMAEALEDVEVTSREALIRGRQAQAGPLLPEGKPQFEVDIPDGARGVLEDAFTPEEVENFVNLARFSPSLENVPHTRLNVLETLIGNAEKKGILQGRLPTMGEIRLLEKVYGPEFAQNLARMRPFREKFWSGFLDLANVPRTILASMDFSFPFRQGIFTAARHPKEFFGNFPAMIRAARDPEFAQAVTDAIRNNKRIIQTADGPVPLGQLLDDADVFIADPAGIVEFSGREEQFLSALAERMPGVQFSQRAFIVYGNKLRKDIFENALLSMAGPAGRHPPTAAEIKDLGTLVNVITGRGTLPADLAKSLSFGMFAPRFAVSRPQFALGTLLGQVPGARRALPLIGAPGTTARVAHLAAQELVSSVATGVGILTLLSLSGAATVELDSRSSDFGKGKVGKQRFDFWGGARPWATLIARMITGQRKTSDGFVIDSDLKKDMLSFGRTKLSPPGTLTVDAIEGETAIGEDFPRAPGTELKERLLFMSVQDIWEAVQQEGVKGGLLAGATAPLGVGVQTYETPSERRKRIWETETNEEWEKTADQWRIANDIANEGNEEFQEAFAPTPEMMETDEIRASEASELGLNALAQGVNQGIPTAGPEFVETYYDYLDRVSGAIYEAVFGKDSTASPEYQVWKEIKLTRDPETLEKDWDSFILQKNAAFDKLDPRLQKALQKHDAPGDDPTLQRVVDQFYKAREIRRGFYDIPKYKKLSATKGDELDEFLTSTVDEFKRRWQRRVGVPLDTMTAIVMAAKESGLSKELLGKALTLTTRGMRDVMVSPKRDTYLENNQNLIGTFYPDLLEAQLSREQEVQLGEQAFEAIAAR